MEEVKEIQLYNRYYKDVKLVEVSENVYQLDKGSSLYIGESYDGVYDREHPEKRTIFSVDPDGGPYLQIGSKISGREIEKFTVEQPTDSADDDIYFVHLKGE